MRSGKAVVKKGKPVNRDYEEKLLTDSTRDWSWPWQSTSRDFKAKAYVIEEGETVPDDLPRDYYSIITLKEYDEVKNAETSQELSDIEEKLVSDIEMRQISLEKDEAKLASLKSDIDRKNVDIEEKQKALEKAKDELSAQQQEKVFLEKSIKDGNAELEKNSEKLSRARARKEQLLKKEEDDAIINALRSEQEKIENEIKSKYGSRLDEIKAKLEKFGKH